MTPPSEITTSPARIQLLMLGDHHQFQKGSALEGADRIPLIVTPPRGRHRSGRGNVDIPVSHYGLMPTVLEVANLPKPDGMDGCALTPLLRAKPQTVWLARLYPRRTEVCRRHGSPVGHL